MNRILKIGASFILVSMVVPILAWGSITIIDNGKSIIRLQEKERSMKELLIEVRTDVKELLKRKK